MRPRVLRNFDDIFADDEELPMSGTYTGAVHWSSRDGKYVVVKGPFPQGFSRTLDSKSIDKAIKRRVTGDEGVMSRKATSTDNYAKTLRALVQETENELGEVAP